MTYATKDSSLLFELNKAIFAPGQLVQGRLYAFNSETNAVSPRDECIITISDPDDTSIAGFTEIKFKKGKYEFEFQLPSTPPLGTWRINARCGNEVSHPRVYHDVSACSYLHKLETEYCLIN